MLTYKTMNAGKKDQEGSFVDTKASVTVNRTLYFNPVILVCRQNKSCMGLNLNVLKYIVNTVFSIVGFPLFS